MLMRAACRRSVIAGRMIADARANGRLFARSFAGGTPLAV